MTGMIAPPHHSRKRHKLDEAQARGFDLPHEVEHAVAVLGKFGEGCVDGKRNTPNIERTDQATWKNIAKAVESNVGGGFCISETTVCRLGAPKRSRSRVAKRHRPLASVQHRKIQKAAFEENIDCHFSCRLVKGAIERSIDRGGTTLHWDGHATWELTSGMCQKQPVVVHKEQFKTAPYSDSSPLIGMMKCVTNSMLFFTPLSKAPVPAVSEKYNKAVAKLPCAVTRDIPKGVPLLELADSHWYPSPALIWHVLVPSLPAWAFTKCTKTPI